MQFEKLENFIASDGSYITKIITEVKETMLLFNLAIVLRCTLFFTKPLYQT
jgi:hypothetical protein